MSTRTPYPGSQRKLVLAFDVGTTYSGVSYSILNPGAVPEIKGVTRFPAQLPGGSSKIPSLVYYDIYGQPRAVGAETLLENIVEQAENEHWFKCEWFKLHLRPKDDTLNSENKSIPPLPPYKSVVDVFSDFFRYLFECSKVFIQETILPDGPAFWQSIEHDIEFVLTHPNGWEGVQQSYMRRAAVLAGLISDSREDQARVQFVTEGEASLHFCLNHGLTISQNEGIIILDAGGGTVDLSAYSASRTEELFEEICRAECCFAGSIYVDQEARLYFQDKLLGSRFSDDIPRIVEIFGQSTKLQFSNVNEPSYVQFGRIQDRDASLEIRSGRMKITGTMMARFFEPSIKAMMKSIVVQRKDSPKAISSLFLVGGFAASPWLFSKLKADLEPLGISISRPDTHVNKAVADGAISFHLDHFVGTRVSRWAHGIAVSVEYLDHDPEHRKRSSLVWTALSGESRVPESFSVILPKNVQVSETQEFRETFCRESSQQSSALVTDISIDILQYRGTEENPCWTDIDPEAYQTCCKVSADTSHIARTLSPKRHRDSVYYELDFEVILLFGLTELKAQIAWKEDGVVKRGPAVVVYDQM